MGTPTYMSGCPVFVDHRNILKVTSLIPNYTEIELLFITVLHQSCCDHHTATLQLTIILVTIIILDQGYIDGQLNGMQHPLHHHTTDHATTYRLLTRLALILNSL